MRLLLAVVLCVSAVGCVRPQYDQYMGEASLLAGEAFDATVDDLVRDNYALREVKEKAAFAIVRNKMEAGQASVEDLDKLQVGVSTDRAERAVIAEIARKGRAAANVVRSLGQRSMAIAQQERQLLQKIGVQSGGEK